MSSIEAGIPTANEFLSLTDLDIDGGESDDDLQKCESPKHAPMYSNVYNGHGLLFGLSFLVCSNGCRTSEKMGGRTHRSAEYVEYSCASVVCVHTY